MPGEDAALIDFGDRYLVAKTDPITFATDLIGWYVVQVNANDLAVMGAKPRWLMVTLILPESTPQEVVRTIFAQLQHACASLSVSLVGGHIEITHALKRPIAVGAMLGEVAKGHTVLISGARLGDAIVMTKSIAIEETALLALEVGNRLIDAFISPVSINTAMELLFVPGISVVEDATIACETVDVHAMHDPTEGGLATGLLELARAAGAGLTIDIDAVPVLPECRGFCDALRLDPLGLTAALTLFWADAKLGLSRLSILGGVVCPKATP